MIFTKWSRLFYLCFLLGSLPALAQKNPDSKNPDVIVWTSGDSDKAREIFSPDVNLVVLSREREVSQQLKSGYLEPHERDALFRKVGIETRLQGMDEFDKDMLMLSAREYTIRELRSDYPMLTEPQLTHLQREMKKVK